MVSPAQLKEDKVRDNVLQAAAKLFQQHGLAKVTLEDIAKAAGRSKSSLYYYYESREEILEAVLDMEILTAKQQFTEEIAQVSTVHAKLEVFSLTKLRIYRKYFGLYAAAIQDARNQAFMFRIGQHYLQSEQRLLLDILEYGKSYNEFKWLATQDLPAIASLLVNSLQGLNQESKLSTNPVKTVHAIKLFINIFVQGLTHLSLLPRLTI